MTATEISNSFEKQIVEMSLKHPDYGASRLVPLLEQEGIQVTASTVHAILKHNYLLTKSKRLAMLDSLRSTKTSSEPASTEPSKAEQQDHVSAHSTAAKPETSIPQPIKALRKPSPRPPWALSVPNLILLGIIGYFWFSAIGNFLQARHDQPTLSTKPQPAQAAPKSEVSVRPLEDYNIIYERNLFGSSAVETPAPEKTVSVEDIPAAGKSIGLKLVGTVVGEDSATSFAIIDNKSTNRQELYHQGDKAGDALIKKIVRNKVIIDAGSGDELLTLELAESGKKIDFALAPQPTVDSQPTATRQNRPSFQLDRQEVQSALGNVDQLIQQGGISPYLQGKQPAGFTITKIEPGSVLSKMGLRSGDTIMGVNGEAITGPDQAGEFFQKLKEGGDVTIRVRKGTGVRRRPRVMHLKIE